LETSRYQQLKTMGMELGIMFVLLVLIIKIAFFKESIVTILRLALALFWLGFIPGYALLLYWKHHLGNIEYMIMSWPVGLAYWGVFGYILGYVGVVFALQTIILPIIALAIGLYVLYRENPTYSS